MLAVDREFDDDAAEASREGSRPGCSPRRTVSLPLDPLPNILIWKNTVVGRRQRQPDRSARSTTCTKSAFSSRHERLTMPRVMGPGPVCGRAPASVGRVVGPMFIYVLRRALYSIPVLLIASFLVFCMVRATFDPTAKLSASRDATAARERMKVEPRARPAAARAIRLVARRRRSGDFGQSYRTRGDVVEDGAAGLLVHGAAHLLGDPASPCRSPVRRRLLGDPAVLRRRLRVHGLGVHRDRDAAVLVRPDRHQFFAVQSSTGSTLDEPILYGRRIALGRRDRLQPRLLPASRRCRCSR